MINIDKLTNRICFSLTSPAKNSFEATPSKHQKTNFYRISFVSSLILKKEQLIPQSGLS